MNLEQIMRSAHRESHKPQGRPHSLKLTASKVTIILVARVSFSLKPKQANRNGEIREGQTGSKGRGRCGEKSQELGRPRNFPEVGRRTQQKEGNPTSCRGVGSLHSTPSAGEPRTRGRR